MVTGLFDLLRFLRHFRGHAFQVGLSGVEVALYIDEYSQPGIVLLVYDFFDQVLHGLQRLAPFPDEQSAVATLNLI